MTIYPKTNLRLVAQNIKMGFADLTVLDDISICLKPNEFVSLIGPSGCGKSTLFNIIAGLEFPQQGQVFIDNQDFTGKTGRVSYMYQKDLLLPWLKIVDNVAVPLLIKGEGKQKARDKAAAYFSLFGLEGFEEKYPFQLSGGMRQRAALLRTYLFSKDIMLLDEPFGSLDAITRSKMQYWLVEVVAKLQASILFVTHDIDEALVLSDRIYVLSERPAKINAEIIVDLPKNRDKELITSDKFNDLKKQILDFLQ